MRMHISCPSLCFQKLVLETPQRTETPEPQFPVADANGRKLHARRDDRAGMDDRPPPAIHDPDRPLPKLQRDDRRGPRRGRHGLSENGLGKIRRRPVGPQGVRSPATQRSRQAMDGRRLAGDRSDRIFGHEGGERRAGGGDAGRGRQGIHPRGQCAVDGPASGSVVCRRKGGRAGRPASLQAGAAPERTGVRISEAHQGLLSRRGGYLIRTRHGTT
mmetsp:Transcript_3198/g.6900  ORF Transcript_3198/g.6900 Transcript_3198/m.6900 type:complete len:216 (+) Transcript_3198:682-1329(+)